METDKPFPERGLALGELFDAVPVPVEVMVYTPEEFDEGVRRGVGIFHAIERDGVELL